MRPIRFVTVFLAVIFLALCATAQPGLSEFREVRREVNTWYYNFSDLAFVIGAVCGLLGGLRVYNNWQSGKHHIDAQVMGWFFSCLFLSLVGAALKALFGVN
ncbi:DUF4134 domain-containing protein [Sphingobacterium cellulitidis]|uniref:DUF4134 domain-containing protein n=1 Tax=Sphingobacterium cellulitidis TaxID=1768011 RepID=UPI000B9453C8|nr:plasmid transfer protein [Sphingobacterium cellulitidis]